MGCIFGVMAGRPDDPTWDDGVDVAAQEITKTRIECGFDDAKLAHRRGIFHAHAYGVALGPGQTVSVTFSLLGSLR